MIEVHMQDLQPRVILVHVAGRVELNLKPPFVRLLFKRRVVRNCVLYACRNHGITLQQCTRPYIETVLSVLGRIESQDWTRQEQL